MADEESLLAVFRSQPNRVFSLADAMEKAGIPFKREKEVRRTIKELVRAGSLEKEPGRRYRLSRAGQKVEGLVVITRAGIPVFAPVGDKKDNHKTLAFFDENSAPNELETRKSKRLKTRKGALASLIHGDRVRVEIVHRGRRPRPYAKFVELVERKAQHYIGVFRYELGANFVELEASPNPVVGQRQNIREILIPAEDTLGANDGDLVEVTFTIQDVTGRSAPLGRVIEILGPVGARETEVRKLMIEHELTKEFPVEVQDQAKAFGTEPSEADVKDRRDVTHVKLVTIDGETAKDFDDAVYGEKLPKGGYKLFVAIADVSHYVTHKSPLDNEAYRRGTSTYLTDRAIPMLPEELSNGLCSLKPKVKRLCFLAELELDPTGAVTKTHFEPALMESKARLTYTQVAAAFDGNADSQTLPLLPMLRTLDEIAKLLQRRRMKRGSLDLDLPEPFVEFDDQGEPVNVSRRARNDAHRLIEDLMIAANEAVARFFVERDIPTAFRIHEPPDPSRLENFAKLCHTLGIEAKLSERPAPKEINRLLEKIADHPSGSALSSLLLRALSQAKYNENCEGHFGLASEAYLHFTSPIRRYPDLIVHRMLKLILKNKKTHYTAQGLSELTTVCSNLERKAVLAERACMDLDRSIVAKQYIGQALEGTISGVQNFGVFVSTHEPYLEGLVPIHTFTDDYYGLDEYGASLIGANHGRRFGVGQPIKVVIQAVHVLRRQVEMRVSDDDEQKSQSFEKESEKSQAPTTFSAKAALEKYKARHGIKTGRKEVLAKAPSGRKKTLRKNSRNKSDKRRK